MPNKKRGNMMIAIAIVVAGLLIASAVFFNGNSNKGNSGGSQVVKNGDQIDPPKNVTLDNLKPVTKDDHIIGDINAPVIIVEFSDFECPFCGKAHPIIEEVVKKYDGQVAWVYRHFPLNQIHPKATPYAEASECIAEIGGNDAFWKFADTIFKTPSAISGLTSIAEKLGVDGNKFDACMASDKYLPKIQNETAEAVSTGGEGTPWSILIDSNGNRFSLSGAQPITAWIEIIDQMLANK